MTTTTRPARMLLGCALVLSLSLVGCANYQTGREFDMAKAQSFEKGKTSKAQVIATLGEPTSTGADGAGAYIEYLHQRTSFNVMQNALGSMGIGSASVNDKVKRCRFTFDARQILRDAACSEGTPDYSSALK